MTDSIKTDDYYYVKAHMWPSMNTDLPHNVLVISSVKSGAAICTACDPCKAAELGRCGHVVAVSLSLVDHVQKQRAITTNHALARNARGIKVFFICFSFFNIFIPNFSIYFTEGFMKFI